MKAPKPVSIPQMATRGPAGTPKAFSIEAKSAALLALKRFAFRGNCSGTTFCHEGVKRQREALLAAVSRDGPRRITRAYQRRNCLLASPIGLGFVGESALPGFEPLASVAA